MIAGGSQFIEEFAQVWNYVGLVGLALGAWVLRKRSLGGERFVHAFWICFSGILLFFAIREGYLASRHLLPLVVLGVGCAAVGFFSLRHHLGWGLIGLMVVGGLLQIAKPIRPERAAYQLAGRWLAEQESAGKVLDTKGWTRLFSGRITYQYDEAKTAFGDDLLGYVVVDPRELVCNSPRARTLERLLTRHARKVAQFPRQSPRVSVYRWVGRRTPSHGQPTEASTWESPHWWASMPPRDGKG